MKIAIIVLLILTNMVCFVGFIRNKAFFEAAMKLICVDEQLILKISTEDPVIQKLQDEISKNLLCPTQ